MGWQRPPLWDPIAGNYRTADGWIRLHTNYRAHRLAVETMLDARDRDDVQARVSTRPAVELERAVVGTGGSPLGEALSRASRSFRRRCAPCAGAE